MTNHPEIHAPDHEAIDHARWCRVKMEMRVIDALSYLEDVEEIAGAYGLAPDAPKYLRRIQAVVRNILEKTQ